MTTIRKANKEDIPAVLELARATFYDTYAAYNTPENMAKYMSENFTEANMLSEFAEENTAFLLAFYENDLAGYVKLRVHKTPPSLAGRRHLELERIYVHKNFQRQKIGSALLQASFRYAQESSFEVLWLGVWQQNTKAIAFYEALGFRIFDTQIFILGEDHQEDYLMKYEIR